MRYAHGHDNPPVGLQSTAPFTQGGLCTCTPKSLPPVDGTRRKRAIYRSNEAKRSVYAVA